MSAADFPEGFQVQIIDTEPDKRAGLVVERYGDRWDETNYHCTECVEEFTHEQFDALLTDADGWEVVAVPASWLRTEVQDMLDSLDDHVTPDDMAGALRGLLDALGHGA